jgi:hypothetical protein
MPPQALAEAAVKYISLRQAARRDACRHIITQ